MIVVDSNGRQCYNQVYKNLIFRRFFHINVWDYGRVAVPCLPIVHGFGRIGCSLVGCCYGKPYDGLGAILYENSLFAPNHQFLFPVQGLEACLNFALAIFLLLYINQFSGKHGLQLYVACYAVIRFILEFFRYDEVRGLLFHISTSQYISLFLIFILGISHLWKKFGKIPLQKKVKNH